MDWLIKLLFIVMLAPFFICLVFQVAAAVAGALLPWLILWGIGILVAIAGGIGGGLILRGRLPPSTGPAALPPGGLHTGAHRIRRPKTPRGRDE